MYLYLYISRYQHNKHTYTSRWMRIFHQREFSWHKGEGSCSFPLIYLPMYTCIYIYINVSDIHVYQHIIQMYTVNKVHMCVISALRVSNSFFWSFKLAITMIRLCCNSALKAPSRISLGWWYKVGPGSIGKWDYNLYNNVGPIIPLKTGSGAHQTYLSLRQESSTCNLKPIKPATV